MEEEEQPKHELPKNTPVSDGQTAEESGSDPITRIPADIEQRVGAPKKYSKMNTQELLLEHHRLATSCDDKDPWDKRLAGDKLVQSIVERRGKDKSLLLARLNEEDVPKEHVRVYRGEDKEGLGQYATTEPVAGKSGKWFSSNLEVAMSFAENKGESGRVRYMDIPQSVFEALNEPSRTKTDIQVPVGYDIQVGSKVLMLDGSIPPEILEKENDNNLVPRESAPTEE